MRETEVRKEIEELKAELLAVRKELSIRYSLFKEDAFAGLKIATMVVGVFFGVKLALKLVRVILGLILRHKLTLGLLGALCYLAWRGYTGTKQNEA